jgi:hypothetical protein
MTKPRQLVAWVVGCAIGLGACARDTATLRPDDAATVEAVKGRILARAELTPDEHAAFDIALDDFERYLLQRFGSSRLETLHERIARSSDVYGSLNETYEINPIFLLQEYNRRSSPGHEVAGTAWTTGVSEHFIFQYHPGSPAERDLEIIKREAENTIVASCTALGFPLERLEARIDSLVEVHDSASGEYYVESGEWAFTGGRILVILTEDLDEYRSLGGTKYSSGRCQLLLTKPKALARPLYCLRLMFRYLDVFQLITLNHEIVHGVHFLAPAADPAVFSDYVDRKAEQKDDWTLGDFERVHGVSHAKYVQEGLATWYGVRNGLFPRAIEMPEIRVMLADLIDAGNEVELAKIVDWDVSLNLLEKMLTVFGRKRSVMRENVILYVGAACFIEFVLAEFGDESLYALMACTEGNAGQRIRKTFGMDVEQVDERWQQWIRVGTAPPASAPASCESAAPSAS